MNFKVVFLLWLSGGVVTGAELATPLIAAVQNNQLHTVEGFLNVGGSASFTDPGTFSLLEHAASQGHSEMIHLLAQHGADLAHVDRYGNTVLHIACRERHESAALSVLSLCKSESLRNNVVRPNNQGITPLHMAARFSSPTLVQQLIDIGCSVDTVDPRDNTPPLWWSAKRGELETSRLLVCANADPELPNNDAITPLLVACYAEHTDVVSLLLTLGRANPNTATTLGVTPLMVASCKGNRPLVEMLLYHNAHIDLIADPPLGGGKAYHYAVKRGHTEIAHLLEVEALKRMIQNIQIQHEHMWGVHEAQLRDAASLDYLQQHPSLRAFYETFARKAIQIFLSYKVLDTGMVERTRDGGLNMVASVIQLLGEQIPIPGASLITTGVGMVIEFIADRRAENIIETMASFSVSLRELDDSIELAAREMTFCYEQPLSRLTEDGAKKLAEAGLRRFMEYARQGYLQRRGQNSLWPQLKEAIVFFNADNMLYTFSQIVINLRTGEWTDEGVFRYSGIQLEDGRMYVSPGATHHENYGFRRGTLEECERLGYQPLNASLESPPQAATVSQDESASNSTPDQPLQPKKERIPCCVIS